jgi:serine/threonine-protein kinase
MANVARQAAAALANTTAQPSAPHPAGQPVRAAGPVNGHPPFGPSVPGSPQAGNGRAPYPPMPRPVSGARGAASVPSGPPVQPQGYRPPSAPPFGQYHQPTPPARPEGSGGRQVLIVLAVVLALLVLLCAGVISFLYKQGKDKGNASLGDTRRNAAVVHTGVSDGAPPGTSYRLSKQAGAKPGWIRANEGRQTL